MVDDTDLLQKYIQDPQEELFTTAELEEFLTDNSSVERAAAEIWAIIAGSKEYLELKFGNFKQEDFRDFSRQALGVSDKFSEIAEKKEANRAAGQAQATLWDEDELYPGIDSLI